MLPLLWRRIAVIIIVLYPVLAGALLLSPDGWSINRLNVSVWYAVTSPVGLHRHITPEAFGAFANVLLFIPFFMALAMLLPRWGWILLGAAISISVEVYQASLGGLREADSVDVLMNTAGAAIGVALGVLIHRRVRRPGNRRAGGADADEHAPTPLA